VRALIFPLLLAGCQTDAADETLYLEHADQVHEVVAAYDIWQQRFPAPRTSLHVDRHLPSHDYRIGETRCKRVREKIRADGQDLTGTVLHELAHVATECLEPHTVSPLSFFHDTVGGRHFDCETQKVIAKYLPSYSKECNDAEF